MDRVRAVLERSVRDVVWIRRVIVRTVVVAERLAPQGKCVRRVCAELRARLRTECVEAFAPTRAPIRTIAARVEWPVAQDKHALLACVFVRRGNDRAVGSV